MINPNSPLGLFLAFLERLTYRGHRRNPAPYIPCHVRSRPVLPDALIPDAEYLDNLRGGLRVAVAVKADAMEMDYTIAELLSGPTYDGLPVLGGYVGVAGEQVAA